MHNTDWLTASINVSTANFVFFEFHIFSSLFYLRNR